MTVATAPQKVDTTSFVEFNGFLCGTLNPGKIVVPPVRDRVRQLTEDEEFEAFCKNIKEEGVRDAIEITSEGLLVDGLRRFSAAKKVGLNQVPVKIKKDEDPDAFVKGLLSNELTRPMEALELARAWTKLIEEKDFTQKQIAEQRGISVGKVSMTIGLLGLPDRAKKMLEDSDSNLSLSAAYELSKIDDEDELNDILDKIDQGQKVSVKDVKDVKDKDSPKTHVNVGREYLGRDIKMVVYPHMVRVTVDVEHDGDNFDDFDPVESVMKAFKELYKKGSKASVNDPNEFVSSVDVLQNLLKSLKTELP